MKFEDLEYDIAKLKDRLYEKVDTIIEQIDYMQESGDQQTALEMLEELKKELI